MKHKLSEMTREARESAERARKLREGLEQATASVDGLVGEARSTLKRAVAFLEREGLRGTKSGAYGRFTGDDAPPPAGAEQKTAARDDEGDSDSEGKGDGGPRPSPAPHPSREPRRR
ncbi:MAG: hypothetical protein KF764_08315 [Labilithrix sp.]|nr:hypothetical protein [Labilithrix sp.]